MKCKHQYKLFRDSNFKDGIWLTFYCIHCLRFVKTPKPQIDKYKELEG